jgi:4-alpha-glucanotransferase
MVPRVAGVLIPLFSLRTHHDLGRGEILDLAPMVDFAREMGLGLIQLLPLDEGAPGESSPYSAMSVFAVDPVYISLRGLKGIGRIALHRARVGLDERGLKGRAPAREAKLPLLERAWRAFSRASSDPDFEAYRIENREWLDDYALFRALKDRFDWSPWEAWPAELRDREPEALAAARRELEGPIARYSWFQFVASRQWSAVRQYAAERRVMLGGDMAFSPARDSAEVWAHRRLFDLDRTIGTPPDAFNERGQRWGLPLPRWDLMREDGFRLWRMRAQRAASMFDLVRVDHVVGLYRTFFFAGAAPDAPGMFTPSDESAQRAQGEEILRALAEAARGCELVAEDLGTVPPWVRASLTAMGIPGYKVMMWEREGWSSPDERFLSPAEYPELSLATTGTHDTETLTMYWRSRSPEERAKLVRALGVAEVNVHAPLDTRALDKIIRALYASPARLVVLPVQDLFGWDDQINRPGTIDDINWSYRLPFAIEDRERIPGLRERIAALRALADASGRLPGNQSD